MGVFSHRHFRIFDLEPLLPAPTMSYSPHWSPFNQENVPHDDLDLSTHSNYRDIRTTHLDLDWTVDWKAQLIHGSCTLQLVVSAENGVSHISLDESYLDIQNVQVDGKDVKFSLGDRKGVCGREMRIELENKLENGKVGQSAHSHISSADVYFSRRYWSKLCIPRPRSAPPLAGSTRFKRRAETGHTCTRRVKQ